MGARHEQSRDDPEEISTIPDSVVRRTPEEDDRRFIVQVLVVSLSVAWVLAIAGIALGRVATNEALAVLAPLQALVAVIIGFYFSRERRK